MQHTSNGEKHFIKANEFQNTMVTVETNANHHFYKFNFICKEARLKTLIL
jgi:hypothetical protein